MLCSIELKRKDVISEKKTFSNVKKYFSMTDVNVYTYEYNNLKVKNIVYCDNISRVKWHKIKKAMPKDLTTLLIENIKNIPDNINYFKPKFYNEFLCYNAFNELLNNLSSINNKINIGVFDKDGSSNILSKIHNLGGNITVCTDNIQYYSNISKSLIDNFGVYITVTSNLNFLTKCNVIYSPRKIVDTLPLTNKAFVFTPFEPAVNINAIVFTDFKVILPSPYIHIKPAKISHTYFASALFELEGCNDLIALKPSENISCGKSYTYAEICNYINSYTKYK